MNTSHISTYLTLTFFDTFTDYSQQCLPLLLLKEHHLRRLHLDLLLLHHLHHADHLLLSLFAPTCLLSHLLLFQLRLFLCQLGFSP